MTIPFTANLPNEDTIWGAREKGTPSSHRKNVSDTSVGTPTLRRQIRGYLSSESVTPTQSKFAECDNNVAAMEPRPILKNKVSYASTSSSSINSVKDQQLPDSFGSYMEAYKGQAQHYPPTIAISKPQPQPRNVMHTTTTPSQYMAPTMDPYTGQYYNPMAYAPMATATATPPPPGLYPQSYMPVYIPMILQPQIPTPAYTYSPPSSSSEVFTGRVKFFDAAQNYGFFTLDCNGADLFAHYDDFLKAGLTKEYIQIAKVMNTRFAFRRVSYYGKYSLSNKAVDIQVIQDQ